MEYEKRLLTPAKANPEIGYQPMIECYEKCKSHEKDLPYCRLVNPTKKDCKKGLKKKKPKLYPR